MLKKLALLMALFCLALPLISCGESADDGRPTVVATLYPPYDFCKNIAGDAVNLKLLLAPGADAHSYDPTPADILTLTDADLLIYCGAGMELWLDRLLASTDVAGAIESGKLRLVNLSKSVDLLPFDGEDADAHDDDHDAHDHGAFDPHIWTSPQNAVKMCDAILSALVGVDGENEELYRARFADYTARLAALCDEVAALASDAAGKTLYFGGSFAFAYLCRDLGVFHRALFDGCASHTEPAPAVLAALMDGMKQDGAPVLFYDSPAEEKVAARIAAETGASLLRLHAIHNISKDELDRGENYLSLMKNNLDVIRQAVKK